MGSLLLSSPVSVLVLVWPPSRLALVRPGTGSAESAGAEPEVGDWSRWFEAFLFFSLCHSGEFPRFQSPWASRDLLDGTESRN